MIHNSDLGEVNISTMLPKSRVLSAAVDIYFLPQPSFGNRAKKKTIAKDFLDKILTRYTPSKGLFYTSKSYSREFIVIAISDQSVGVDIEKVNTQFKSLELAEACFSVVELQSLESSNETMFFRIWTRKEAVLKSVGSGIIEEIKLIPTLNGSHELPALSVFKENKDYYVYTLPVADHQLSICSAYRSESLNFYKISSEVTS